jgi:hypothetical protein
MPLVPSLTPIVGTPFTQADADRDATILNAIAALAPIERVERECAAFFAREGVPVKPAFLREEAEHARAEVARDYCASAIEAWEMASAPKAGLPVEDDTLLPASARVGALEDAAALLGEIALDVGALARVELATLDGLRCLLARDRRVAMPRGLEIAAVDGVVVLRRAA